MIHVYIFVCVVLVPGTTTRSYHHCGRKDYRRTIRYLALYRSSRSSTSSTKASRVVIVPMPDESHLLRNRIGDRKKIPKRPASYRVWFGIFHIPGWESVHYSVVSKYQLPLHPVSFGQEVKRSTKAQSIPCFSPLPAPRTISVCSEPISVQRGCKLSREHY
jgi:hypothetical protein